MNKYLIIAFVIIISFVYFAGSRVATERCNTKIAEISASKQSDMVKKMDEINEKTFNTGVHDIRRVLREKYTIAE